ncbi:hypothetical protein [Mesorhizobium sp. Root157]|uniref:hypothetical protein n=1 Tax=Mesorhizobium sp. Root157 TaxID=1736477 RepID=UPI001FCD195A|nr:hypothetical protein [Mesorhizobium sp. Root157]
MTDPKARPDAGAAARLEAMVSDDIVDAEFVTLPRFPSGDDRGSAQPGAAPDGPPLPDGMGMLRKAEAKPARPFTERGGPAFWAAGIGLASAAFWIAGGHALVSHMALAAEGGSRSMLSISAVTSHVDESGEHPVLFVDGEAGNDGTSAAPLPPLEISVTGNDGSITRYRLGTSDRALAPGERFAFSSRVEVPRNGVKTVSVAFAG